MTIREALQIINHPGIFLNRYNVRQDVELNSSYCAETKELDEKINKINAKIKKLKADIDKIEGQKEVIIDRYISVEMEKREKKITEARKVIAAADRLIAEEMKRTDDKEEKQNDA